MITPDTPEKLPISSGDICNQVILLGGDVTENIERMAEDMAARLAAYGVVMPADRENAGKEQLSQAALAKVESLFRFAKANTREIVNAMVAVNAAVSVLLGDLTAPSIGAMQKDIRLAKQRAADKPEGTVSIEPMGIYISDGGDPNGKLGRNLAA